MASHSTADFRAAISHQSTKWLSACLADWRRTGAAGIASRTMRARIIAMVRAELRRRDTATPFVDVSNIHDYGVAQRLSNSVRVF